MKKFIYQINPVVILTTTKPLAKISNPKKVWSDEYPDFRHNQYAVLKAIKEIFGDPFIIRIGDNELGISGITDSGTLLGFEVEEEGE